MIDISFMTFTDFDGYLSTMFAIFTSFFKSQPIADTKTGEPAPEPATAPQPAPEPATAPQPAPEPEVPQRRENLYTKYVRAMCNIDKGGKFGDVPIIICGVSGRSRAIEWINTHPTLVPEVGEQMTVSHLYERVKLSYVGPKMGILQIVFHLCGGQKWIKTIQDDIEREGV